MGVLNLTPDSFSDGGRYLRNAAAGAAAIDADAALHAARRMVDEGASIIDVGGESTRPGAQPVPVQQELDRVIPVIKKIAAELDCVISLDSSSPQVMQEAATAGVGLLNDVRSFRREGALQAAVASGLPLCIMHMRGEPGTMQQQPEYRDVVTEVVDFLALRLQQLCAAGVGREQVILDPGFGFGKRLQHNLQLLAKLQAVSALQCPVLVGMSRKSMIGEVLSKPVDQRLHGGLALAAIAVMHGASIVRTHDVAATVDAIAMAQAVRDAQ
ncbi:MAG: dihydropteroate synthase [Pseudomonadales bacterium]|nr:dihydropteroate synthase [Pseudomonadales bacterium]